MDGRFSWRRNIGTYALVVNDLDDGSDLAGKGSVVEEDNAAQLDVAVVEKPSEPPRSSPFPPFVLLPLPSHRFPRIFLLYVPPLRRLDFARHFGCDGADRFAGKSGRSFGFA